MAKENIEPQPKLNLNGKEYDISTLNEIEKEIYVGPKEYPIKIQIKTFKGRKYLSPEHESETSNQYAVELLLQNKDYKISIQTHKYLGLE